MWNFVFCFFYHDDDDDDSSLAMMIPPKPMMISLNFPPTHVMREHVRFVPVVVAIICVKESVKRITHKCSVNAQEIEVLASWTFLDVDLLEPLTEHDV